MKYDDKFEDFYNKLVAEESGFLESKKNEAGFENVKNNLLTIVLIIIGIVLFFYASIKATDLLNIYFSMLIYIIIAVFIKRRFSSDVKKIEYTSEFNEKVIKRMLDLIDKDAFYHRNDYISSDTYDDAEFEKYDRFFSNYSVSGRIENKFDYSFGDVKTEYVEKSDKHHRYVNLFSGLFMTIDSPKTINNPIYIKNLDNILFRPIGFYKVPSKKIKIKFDTPEFEKEFDVYSADNNIVSKILTPDIIKSLVDFRKEMKIRSEITIKDNHIYYRFFCGTLYKRNILNSSTIDKKSLYNYYKVVDFSLNISEKLTDLINNI